MPRGRTRTSKKLADRRLEAFECFSQGYTDVATAAKVGVTRQTVAAYRRIYEEQLQARVAANPGLLQNVLQNTLRVLDEIDQVREDAWKRIKERYVRTRLECPECGHSWKELVQVPVSDQTRTQLHNVLLKAADQRAKLFGLLGVKAEMLAHIEAVNTVQRIMLAWMGENLCSEDREKLARLLETELRGYLNVAPVLELEGVEEPVDSVV
jgi:hypothetical protein